MRNCGPFLPKKLEKVENIVAVRRKKNTMPENKEIERNNTHKSGFLV